MPLPGGVSYCSRIDYVELMQRVTQDVYTADALQNRYLYLGSHGARLWTEIDKLYRPGVDGKALLSDHFSAVDEIIRSDSPDKSNYDIVSLGTGTGEDDVMILKHLMTTRKREPISFVAVDLSWPLLARGASHIAHSRDAYGQLASDRVKVTALCTDIEDLRESIDLLGRSSGSGRSNERALFHLLGLTLANNDELVLLRAIASTMSAGDYLLLGVDFSGDSPVALQRTREAYEIGARELIDRFLCGPLLTAVEFSVTGTDEALSARLSAKWRIADEDVDWVSLPITVEHNLLSAELTGQSGLSRVPGAQALVRYHRLEHVRSGKGPVIHKRLCDYSSKYTREGFSEFLNKLTQERIPLVPVKELGELSIGPRSPQELILLRRESVAPDVAYSATAEKCLRACVNRVSTLRAGFNTRSDVSKFLHQNSLGLEKIVKQSQDDIVLLSRNFEGISPLPPTADDDESIPAVLDYLKSVITRMQRST